MHVERDTITALSAAWDADPPAFWEPRVPRVGERVWTRISPECQADHQWLNGLWGTVTGVNWDVTMGAEPLTGDSGSDAYRGHWYWVDFDLPVMHPLERRPIVADLFAACELEPAVQDVTR